MADLFHPGGVVSPAEASDVGVLTCAHGYGPVVYMISTVLRFAVSFLYVDEYAGSL